MSIASETEYTLVRVRVLELFVEGQLFHEPDVCFHLHQVVVVLDLFSASFLLNCQPKQYTR
eukprot:7087028-Heterocapsa_arctica.AAC.2